MKHERLDLTPLFRCLDDAIDEWISDQKLAA